MDYPLTIKALNVMANDVVRKAQLELGMVQDRESIRATWRKQGRNWQPLQVKKSKRRGRINSTGSLSRSLHSEVAFDTFTGAIEVDIIGNDYGDIINAGRGPTKRSGGGIVQTRIKQWAKDKPVRVRQIPPIGSGLGSQFIKSTPSSRNAQSFMIARKIHHFGFKATHFMDNAVDAIVPKHRDMIKEAFEKDIINSLP